MIFNPSPHSYKYYGVVELNDLFAKHGFKAEFFGDTPISKISMIQKILRPVKKIAVNLNLMPKSMAGKKLLKRLVFGDLVEMPAEIGPQITPVPSPGATGQAQIDADLRAKRDNPRITRISQIEEVMAAKRRKNGKSLYRGCYVQPDRISSEEANMSHKVIYCVATLDPQITQINAD